MTQRQLFPSDVDVNRRQLSEGIFGVGTARFHPETGKFRALVDYHGSLALVDFEPTEDFKRGAA